MCLERVALVQACRAYRIGTLQACWTAECTQPAYNQRKGATVLLARQSSSQADPGPDAVSQSCAGDSIIFKI